MEALLSTKQVSQVLQIPMHTLANWRYQGMGPASVKVGKHRRYKPSAIRAWLKELAEAEAALQAARAEDEE